MQAVSDEFKAALALSHTVVSRVDLLRGGVVIREALPVRDGRVSADKTADVRRSCSLDLLDPLGDLLPLDTSADLSPYGNEVQLWRGIALPGGDELISLGIFRIADVPVEDDGTQRFSVTGYDRSRTIRRNVFTSPYLISAGTNYGDAIGGLLDNRMPGIVLRFASTTELTPLLLFDVGDDPWMRATQMAESIGMELYIDVDGAGVLRPEPDPLQDEVVATYATGPTSMLAQVGKQYSDDPGYNGVVIQGESTSNTVAVRGEAWDTDPNSPTYYLGPYGRVPLVETSPFVTTTAQATAAARARLQQRIGGTEQVPIVVLPNPAHEPGDVVAVTRAEIGVDVVALLEGFEMPLSYGGLMNAKTKQRRSAA